MLSIIRLISVTLLILCAGHNLLLASETPPIVTGRVTDTSGDPVSGAVIKVFADDGNKMLCYAITDPNGNFKLNLTKAPHAKQGVITLLGYKSKTFGWPASLNAGDITIEDESVTLNEVYVKTPKIFTRGDTTVFDVSAFAKANDANIEDVIKRLPGLSVRDDGAIYYNGKAINKFYIEGLDMLQGRYALATRNIQPKDIENISLYENHQPVKALKDFIDSDHAALNLKLKSASLLRPIGAVTAGGGYSDRMLGLIEANMLLISPKFQDLLTVKANNSGTNYNTETVDLYQKNLPETMAATLFSEYPFGVPSLPSRQYARNTSYLGSINHLSKLNDVTQLSVYADWIRNTGTFSGNLSRIYEAPDVATVVIDQTSYNDITTQGVNSAIQLTRNSAKTYISNTLKFTGKFSRNLYNLTLPYQVKQRVASNLIKVDNRLSLIFRSGRQAYQLKSETSFSNVPFSRLSADNLTEDTLIVSQNSTGLKFFNHEYTTFTHLFSRSFTGGIQADFRISYDRYNSFGRFGAAGRILPSNDIEGTDIALTAFPYIEYKVVDNNARQLVSFRLGAQLSQSIMHYSLRHDNSDINYNPFLPTYSLSVKYTPKGFSTLALYGVTGKILSTPFRTFVTQPIFNSYRSFSSPGNGRGSTDNYSSATLSYSYTAMVRGLDVGASASYMSIKSKYLSSVNVTPDYNDVSLIRQNNTTETWDLNLSGSKHFLGYNDVLKFSLAYSRTKSTSAMQQHVFGMTSDKYAVKVSNSKGFISNLLNNDISVSFKYFDQKIPGKKNHNTDWSIADTFTVLPTDNLSFSVTGDWKTVNLNNADRRSDFFLNADAQWKIKKLQIGLKLENLTNRKLYTSFTTYRGNITRYYAKLNPVSFMTTVKYSF